jgi:hypothetical protein
MLLSLHLSFSLATVPTIVLHLDDDPSVLPTLPRALLDERTVLITSSSETVPSAVDLAQEPRAYGRTAHSKCTYTLSTSFTARKAFCRRSSAFARSRESSEGR